MYSQSEELEFTPSRILEYSKAAMAGTIEQPNFQELGPLNKKIPVSQVLTVGGLVALLPLARSILFFLPDPTRTQTTLTLSERKFKTRGIGVSFTMLGPDYRRNNDRKF